MNLNEYFKKNSNLLFKKVSENTYNIKSVSKFAKLIGSCTNESIDLDLISKSGKTLLSFKEDYSNLDNSEEYVVNKIMDAYEAFEGVSSLDLDTDLKRGSEEEEKEILLDDTNELEEVDDSINSLSELRHELNSIIDRSQNLVNNYDDNKESTKLIINGIIQSVYQVVSDLDEFIENNSDIKESVSVAPKVDYIDIACKGLSQAGVALKGSNYEDLIGKIRDLSSELKLSK